MDIVISVFQRNDFSSLVRLLDDSFHIANPAKDALIRWKFFDPIHHGGTVMAVARDGADVVSQYANIPLTLAEDGRPVPAMVCGDMATAPTYRGRGLISQLARTVYAEVTVSGAALSIGYSNDAGVKVDQNAKGYGYRVVGRFARYARPALIPLPTPYRLEPTDDFHEDELPPAASGLRLHKTVDYLRWRYIHKPNGEYRIFRLTRSGVPRGFAVLRDAKYRCHLVDLIAAPDRDVLRAVQNTVIRRGRHVLVAYVLDNAFWRGVLRGFVRLPAHPRLDNYYLTVKPHCEPLPSGWDTPERWRLMGGDIL